MVSIILMVQKTFELTDAEFELVRELYRINEKVKAIKFIKSQYNLKLVDAKNLCDEIHNRNVD